MEIIIVACTGLIGSLTVAIRRRGRFEMLAASPDAAVGAVTRAGLAEARLATWLRR